MKIEIEETLDEHGGTLLVDDDGNMVAWLPIGNGFLEVSYNGDNYPALNVSPCDSTEQEIVDHINKNLGGWYVRKCNLKGINVTNDNEVIEICPHCGQQCDDECDIVKTRGFTRNV